MRCRRAVAVLSAVALGASCRSPASQPAVDRPALPRPVVSAAASPSPTPTPSHELAFSAARAERSIRALVRIGPRESVGRSYRTAARYVERRLVALGYRVELQRFYLPAGTNDGIAVRAGETFNVVARPPGLRPTNEQVVVGAHLDTTPDSPGANDNASGVAVLLELARLASRTPPRVPAVFVAFAGEERIRRSGDAGVYAEGSRAFVRDLSRRQKRAIRGMLNIDMVGNGGLRVMGKESSMTRTAFAAARAIGAKARRDNTFFYSDHLAFQLAQVPVAWLWTGDHRAFHSPADDMSVIERSALRETGRVAWETLRRMRA